MTGIRLGFCVAIISLAAYVGAVADIAPQPACPQFPVFEKFDPAVLVIKRVTSPNAGLNIEFKGSVELATSTHPTGWKSVNPANLCEAVLGSAVINETPICSRFEPNFEEGDTASFDGRRLFYDLSAESPGFAYSGIQLSNFDSASSCASSTTVLIKRDPAARMSYVSPAPNRLDALGASFALDGVGTSFRLRILFQEKNKAELGAGDIGPPSVWNELDSKAKNLSQAIATLVLTLVFLTTASWYVMFREGNDIGPDLAAAGRLFLVGLVLLICGHWFGSGIEQYVTVILKNWPAAGLFTADNDSFLLLVALGLSVLFTALLGTAHAIWRKRRFYWIISTLLGACSLGMVLVSAVVAAIYVMDHFEAARPPGYEIPALCVSFAIGLIMFLPLRQIVFRRWVFLFIAAALAAVTLLYPFTALVHLPGDMNSAFSDFFRPRLTAFNTKAWFGFLTLTLARPVVVGALLLAGFGLCRRGDDALMPTRLLGLFLLSNIQFSGLGLANLLCVLAVWLVASRAVLTPSPSDCKVPQDTPQPRTLALLSGTAACIIFWLQYTVPAPNATEQFSLLVTATVLFVTFASAALGMLLVSSAYNNIRGQTAFVKALYVIGAAFANAVASNFSTIVQTHSLTATLAAQLSTAGAILLVSVWVYDLPKIGHGLTALATGGEDRKEFVKQLLPIVSAVAVALATTLTTKAFDGLSAATRDRLKGPQSSAVTSPGATAEGNPKAP